VKQLFLGLSLVVAACSVEGTTTEETTEATTEAKHRPPDPGEVAFASDVADAMIDRIVTLLFREFEVTTPENAAVGSAAISNVFHNGNPTMRLVGDVDPLQSSNNRARPGEARPQLQSHGAQPRALVRTQIDRGRHDVLACMRALPRELRGIVESVGRRAHGEGRGRRLAGRTS
jgi:hypothetical protein